MRPHTVVHYTIEMILNDDTYECKAKLPEFLIRKCTRLRTTIELSGNYLEFYTVNNIRQKIRQMNEHFSAQL